jgi:hypothetical protein
MLEDPRAASTSDGSNSITRDSKMGLVVNFVVGVAVAAAIGGLTSVDTSTWSGWWVPFATLGISTALGWLTTYKARRK